ncbi:MAG: CopG family transcriptional regulator [Waddliaceae bacterium]
MDKYAQKTIRTSVILSEELHKQIIDLAKKNDVSTAWIIRYALNQFLETSGRKLKLKPIKE